MQPCLKQVFLLRQFVNKLCHHARETDTDHVCNTRETIFCASDFSGKICDVALFRWEVLKVLFLDRLPPWWRPWILICLFLFVVVLAFYKILTFIKIGPNWQNESGKKNSNRIRYFYGDISHSQPLYFTNTINQVTARLKVDSTVIEPLSRITELPTQSRLTSVSGM